MTQNESTTCAVVGLVRPQPVRRAWTESSGEEVEGCTIRGC